MPSPSRTPQRNKTFYQKTEKDHLVIYNDNEINSQNAAKITDKEIKSKPTSRDQYLKNVRKRETSFLQNNCPLHVKQQRKILAASGFYYTGRSDVIKCAFCKGELHHSKLEFDLLEDHGRFFPKCPYVLNKGNTDNLVATNHLGFLEKIEFKGSKKAVKECEQPVSEKFKGDCFIKETISSLREENEKLRKAKTCLVCNSATVQTLLLPCQHIVCCKGCALNRTSCPKPKCLKSIKQRLPVYLG